MTANSLEQLTARLRSVPSAAEAPEMGFAFLRREQTEQPDETRGWRQRGGILFQPCGGGHRVLRKRPDAG